MDKTIEAHFHERYGVVARHVARAPGRIEFIGNHTDYNGGLVLGAAIDRHITVAVSLREDDRIRLHSLGMDPDPLTKLDELNPFSGEDAWANYPLGVFKVLRETGLQAERGFNLAVQSTLPSGSGLSSSAALELSTGLALATLYNFETTLKDMALYGQKAENTFVGVPCGVLDQAVSAFGQRDALVRVDATRNEFSPVAIPTGLHFWIFNPNVKHSLVESLYAQRFRECREALAVMQKIHPGRTHLAEYTSAEVRAAEASFDPVVFKRARHITEEHERVIAMMEAIEAKDTILMGELLNRSHASSRDLLENSSEEQDALVEALQARSDVLGARLSGGGFGGAVLALTTDAFKQTSAEAVQSHFQKSFGEHSVTVFHVVAGPGAHLIR